MKHLIAALLLAPTLAHAQFHTDAAAREVESCSPATLTPEQAGALVSFAHSRGEGGYCKTTMALFVRTGRMRDACALLTAYVLDDAGNRSDELLRRRQIERELCEVKQ